MTLPSCILVTGGAGYIESQTVLQLLLDGYNVVVVDNLDNSSEIAITRVRELAGDRAINLSFHKLQLFELYETLYHIQELFNRRFVLATSDQRTDLAAGVCSCDLRPSNTDGIAVVTEQGGSDLSLSLSMVSLFYTICGLMSAQIDTKTTMVMLVGREIGCYGLVAGDMLLKKLMLLFMV